MTHPTIDHPELVAEFAASTDAVQVLKDDIFHTLMGDAYYAYYACLSLGEIATLGRDLDPEIHSALAEQDEASLGNAMLERLAGYPDVDLADAAALAGLDAVLSKVGGGGAETENFEVYNNRLSEAVQESFGDVAYIDERLPNSGFGIVDARHVSTDDLQLYTLHGAQEILDPGLHHRVGIHFKKAGALVVPTMVLYHDTVPLADNLMNGDAAITEALGRMVGAGQVYGETVAAAWLSDCRNEIRGVLGAAVENIYDGVIPQLQEVKDSL